MEDGLNRKRKVENMAGKKKVVGKKKVKKKRGRVQKATPLPQPKHDVFDNLENDNNNPSYDDLNDGGEEDVINHDC